MGFVAAPLPVSKQDRLTLEAWLRAPSTPQRLATRAKIVLASAEGETVRSIASRLDISQLSVCRWKERYRKGGVAGLKTQQRSGRPPRFTEADEARIIAATMIPPAGRTHWSSRSLARKLGVSHMQVHRVWQARGLQPHRVETFKFSTDPEFDTKMTDVVGLYLAPPERAIVLCVDEKSQIQALNRTQPILPLRPGIPTRMTHDYKRNGTTSLFAALEVASGRVEGRCFSRHTHVEFIKFLSQLAKRYPGVDLHLICDNYGTHKHPAVNAWLAKNPRFHLHFTPTSASWLNLVERWFARITDEAIRRGSFDSVRALEAAISKYLANWNANPTPFRWTKSARQIRRRISRACAHVNSTFVTGH